MDETSSAIRPLSRCKTRSANSRIRGSCVTTTAVLPSPVVNVRKSRITSWPAVASSAAVGSSARMSSGSPTRARAMATRWHCPVLNSDGSQEDLVAQSDVGKQTAGVLPSDALRFAPQQQRHANVLEHRQPTNQLESLKDKTDVIAPQGAARCFVEPAQVVAQHPHGPAVGRENAAENRQQRALSAARGAHQKNALAGVDRQLHAAQRRRRRGAAAVRLVQVVNDDRRRYVFHRKV